MFTLRSIENVLSKSLDGCCYSAVQGPNSINPQPKSRMPSTPYAVLSIPHARPIGLSKVYPYLVLTVN
jgi:hypothetical protein